MAKQKLIKVEWWKTSEMLPTGNTLEGIICLGLPSPKTCMYGKYENKEGKSVIGFHDLENGKLREYKVDLWAYYPMP